MTKTANGPLPDPPISPASSSALPAPLQALICGGGVDREDCAPPGRALSDLRALAEASLGGLNHFARMNGFARQAQLAFDAGDYGLCIEECAWAAERGWEMEHAA